MDQKKDTIWTDQTTEKFSAKNSYRMVGGGGGIPASTSPPSFVKILSIKFLC